MTAHVQDATDVELRRAYLMSIAIIWSSMAILFLLGRTLDPFLNIAVPALLIYLGLLLIGYWRHLLPVQTVGPLVLFALVAVVFGRLVLWRLGMLADIGSLGDSLSLAVQLAASFPIAFMVFGTRRGLRVSLVIYVAFISLYGPVIIDGLLGQGAYPGSPVAASITMTYAVLITMIHLLASRVEQLATERARGDVLAGQATTDPLTGIANRRRLDDELGRLVAQSRRYGQPLSLILIDLDLFKHVNDNYGHAVGDQVLRETVRRLSETIRDADLLGRWGGEEFLLAAPNTAHADACTLAERCRRAIADLAMPTVGQVTASFGVATHAGDEDLRLLLRRADLALYTAKTEGRDRVVGLQDVNVSGFSNADGSGGE